MRRTGTIFRTSVVTTFRPQPTKNGGDEVTQYLVCTYNIAVDNVLRNNLVLRLHNAYLSRK